MRVKYWLLMIVVLSCDIQAASTDTKLKDLYFGEALFYAYQEDYFGAISRLDTELYQYYGLDEPGLNSLSHHIDHAEFSVGDFELFYRMHARAGRAIKAVIEGNVDETVRNEAIYRLSKIYYQKQQFRNALLTIGKLIGKVPERLRYEEPFLRAQIYIATGKFSEAEKLLIPIENAEGMLGFAGYNLGIAMFKSGKEEAGIKQLEKVGQIQSKVEKVLSMRDKANLVLGFRLLEAEKPELAKQYLDRVRLDGPFSNKALLGSGWAAASLGRFDRALVPWTILSKRNVTNKSVQESLLGVPHAYGKLKLFGKSAILYGRALEAYDQEINRLDASVKSVREGKFLQAVVGEELKKDKNWLIKLRELPEAPETYYLMQMMASNDFQELLKNYYDLTELQQKLVEWEGSLVAYADIIKIRKAYYDPLLPQIDTRFRALDSKMKLRMAQRDGLIKRFNEMLIRPRPEFLTSANESVSLRQLDEAEAKLKKQGNLTDVSLRRIDRMRGIISWDVQTEYHDRFTRAHGFMQELDENGEQLTKDYQSFVRARQAATHSYKGYDKQLTQLRIKIRQAKGKVKMLLARQGHMIDVMAVNELEGRRKRIEGYQVKARFAMADNYDRATKKQQDEKIRKSIEEDKNKEQTLTEQQKQTSTESQPESQPMQDTDPSAQQPQAEVKSEEAVIESEKK